MEDKLTKLQKEQDLGMVLAGKIPLRKTKREEEEELEFIRNHVDV